MTEASINRIVAIPRSVSLGEMEHLKLMDRSESKYIVPFKMIPFFLQRIDGNYRVLEIDSHRIFAYSNIYFDTPDFLFYNQHVRGKLPRNKVRLRRYENSGLTYLEIKKRTNRDRVKKWRLASPELCPQLTGEQVSFINENVQQLRGSLSPVLLNRFNRITLAACREEERVTIDFDISWSSMNADVFNCPYLSVIEIKRAAGSKGSFFAGLLRERLIHPTGFSKYCTGSAALDSVKPQNTLKSKFLQMKKIEYDNAGCNDN